MKSFNVVISKQSLVCFISSMFAYPHSAKERAQDQKENVVNVPNKWRSFLHNFSKLYSVHKPSWQLRLDKETPFSCPIGWYWNCSIWFVGTDHGLLFLYPLCSNLFLFLLISIDQLWACLYRLFSLARAFCSSLVPSGPKCVSARSDQLNKQT